MARAITTLPLTPISCHFGRQKAFFEEFLDDDELPPKMDTSVEFLRQVMRCLQTGTGERVENIAINRDC